MPDREVRQSELTRIYRRDGELKASVIVREARPVKAPLHDEFEWDDKVAGHAYRLSQARKMIRVTVIRDETGAESRFIHVPPISVDGPTASTSDREGVYKPISVIVKEPSDYQRALQQLIVQRNAMDAAIRELRRACKKEGKQPDLMVQLVEGFEIVKRTLTLMAQAA